MNYDAIIRDTERGRGRKVLVLVLALLAVALVIGAVVRGFSGQSTYPGASALTSGVGAYLLAGSSLRRIEGRRPS